MQSANKQETVDCVKSFSTFVYRSDTLAMGDEEQATLDGQFIEYSKLMDNKRSGSTITLYRSDFWMRQAKIIDDRKITMTDTGKLFNKFWKFNVPCLQFCLLSSIFLQIKSLQDFIDSKYFSIIIGFPGIKYCSTVWDGFLCWPPTEANTIAFQNCPAIRLIDTSNNAFRKCDGDGHWIGRHINDTNGWTNYTPCYPERVRILFSKVYDENGTAAESKFDIAQRTRQLEIVGFSISLLALLISMIIYCRFRSLRNSRTKIHQSLFTAMILQVLIRLTVYIDQAVTRRVGDNLIHSNVTRKGIDDMPYVCEMSYIFLEYTISVMFMWMFIEGLYLHNVVTANSLRQRLSHAKLYMVGWGVPVVFTVTWAIATAFLYNNDNLHTCWYGYNFTWRYWILQGPRFATIMINLIFLLKILKVLIVKLQDSRTSELEKLRKAVRAALVLLPLLGITNLLNMFEAPLDGAVWKFALWCYATHFLRSFQGFFIALIYCFMNGEVKSVVLKQYQTYKLLRMDGSRQKNMSQNNEGITEDSQRSTVDDKEVEGNFSFMPCCMSMCWGRATPPTPPPADYLNDTTFQPIQDTSVPPITDTDSVESSPVITLRMRMKTIMNEFEKLETIKNKQNGEWAAKSSDLYAEYLAITQELEYRTRHLHATKAIHRVRYLNALNAGEPITKNMSDAYYYSNVHRRDLDGNFELVSLPDRNEPNYMREGEAYDETKLRAPTCEHN